MQTLYLGFHHGRWLEQLTVPLCVTVRTMEKYRDDWETHPKCFTSWILDSGAFVEISKYGQWRHDPDLFGGIVTRILDNVGTPPVFCAPQDWCCERQSRAASGLTVAEHQDLTIESVCYLRAEFRHIPWIPVLQGWHVAEYVDHVSQYQRAGIDLTQEPLVGLGSVCRRSNVSAVIDIITTLYGMGIRLHGSGCIAPCWRGVAGCLSRRTRWPGRGRLAGTTRRCPAVTTRVDARTVRASRPAGTPTSPGSPREKRWCARQFR